MRVIVFCLGWLLAASTSFAETRPELGLRAPTALIETGFLKHLLPRFSLKTGIRVSPDPEGTLSLAPTPPGHAVFADDSTTYYLDHPDTPEANRFADWLGSEIGQRTITAYQPEGAPLFRPADSGPADAETVSFDGDAESGALLSHSLCGRCHVTGPQNRMGGLGSTPSFAVLRSLPDWQDRFQRFYVLKPHGAFTRIDGVTPPFDPERPPPIVPVDMSLDDLDAILAFVAATTAADLGAPLQLQ